MDRDRSLVDQIIQLLRRKIRDTGAANNLITNLLLRLLPQFVLRHSSHLLSISLLGLIMSQLDISNFRLGYCDAEATGAVITVAIAAVIIVLTIALIDAHKARRSARKQALQRSMHRHPARHRAPRYTPLAVLDD